MDVGLSVKLNSFNGSVSTPNNCEPSENYWLLIGKQGIVVKTENTNSRVLVQFKDQVSELGLNCHNEIPNSLLIGVSDLEVI
ncbi:MAG: hypothetical protein GY714_21770 [Desulfobacterales bacterium]|nr:hypothetical protein [Desulfobacterales bacterium]